MKKTLIFTFIAIVALQVSAVNPTSSWTKTFDLTRPTTKVSGKVQYFKNNLEKTALSKDSSVYVTGVANKDFSFWGTDVEPLATGSTYLLKYKKDGTPAWGVYGIGGSTPTDMATDNTGNVYIIGQYGGDVMFLSIDGNYKTLKGSSEDGSTSRTFVVKYNKEGYVQWVRGDSIILDENDWYSERSIANKTLIINGTNIVVAGDFCGNTKTFGNEIASTYPYSDEMGVNFYHISSFYNTISATDGSIVNTNVIKAAEKIYNTTSIRKVISDGFGFILNGKYGNDSSIINSKGKYNNVIVIESNGSKKLFKVDTNATYTPYTLTLDVMKKQTDGSILIGGAFQSNLKLDDTHTLTAPSGLTHYYLAKLDASLNVTWATSFGSDASYINAFSSTEGKGVNIAANDSYIAVLGEYKGTITIGGKAITSVADSTDCFLAVYNNSTNTIDTLVSFGGNFADYTNGISNNGSKEFVVSGFLKSNSTNKANILGSEINTSDSAKVFVSKIIIKSNSSTGIFSNNSKNTITISTYPNPVIKDLNVLTDKSVNSIKVFDLVGKEVAKNESETTIDLSSLTSGVYIVVVDIDGTKSVSKIVKK